MSASANAMNNLQSVFQEFFGGGVAVNTPNGGFSTTLDPTTGTYKTIINAKGTTISTAGIGQSPVSVWTQLTSTTGGWLLLAAAGIIVLVLLVGHVKARG